jgi:nucleoside-diphosphate-sugar epimerase
MLELAERIVKQAGSQSPIICVEPTDDRFVDDPQVRRPDITRARAVLGWEPRVPVDEGLAETIAYFRQRI